MTRLVGWFVWHIESPLVWAGKFTSLSDTVSNRWWVYNGRKEKDQGSAPPPPLAMDDDAAHTRGRLEGMPLRGGVRLHFLVLLLQRDPHKPHQSRRITMAARQAHRRSLLFHIHLATPPMATAPPSSPPSIAPLKLPRDCSRCQHCSLRQTPRHPPRPCSRAPATMATAAVRWDRSSGASRSKPLMWVRSGGTVFWRSSSAGMQNIARSPPVPSREEGLGRGLLG